MPLRRTTTSLAPAWSDLRNLRVQALHVAELLHDVLVGVFQPVDLVFQVSILLVQELQLRGGVVSRMEAALLRVGSFLSGLVSLL